MAVGVVGLLKRLRMFLREAVCNGMQKVHLGP